MFKWKPVLSVIKLQPSRLNLTTVVIFLTRLFFVRQNLYLRHQLYTSI